jgi:hypothetical protein
MMRNLFTAAVLTMLPLTASAQDLGNTEMEQGLSMLEAGVSKALSHHDIETDVMSLTLNQLAMIKEIVDGSDGSNQKQRIEQTLAR